MSAPALETAGGEESGKKGPAAKRSRSSSSSSAAANPSNANVSSSSSSAAASGFPGVRSHVVDANREGSFVGVRFRVVEPQREDSQAWIRRLNEERQKRLERMTPAPRSVCRSAIGRRPRMEDRHATLDEVENCVPEEQKPLSVWAVYDGHGGEEAAQLALEMFDKCLLAKLAERPQEVDEVLKDVFAEVDAEVLKKLGQEHLSVGTTVVMLLLMHKTLYVANCGDSEAILGRKEPDSEAAKPVELTVKHKPSDAGEKQRIEELGGFIYANRVFGTLSVSRSLGDGEFKPPKADAMFVTSEPHIHKIDLTPDDKFAIIACDGLWDKVNHEEAVHFVDKLLRVGKTLEDAADFLLEEALDRNTKDNVSVIVIDFRWGTNDEESSEAGAAKVVDAEALPPGFRNFLKESRLAEDDAQITPILARVQGPSSSQINLHNYSQSTKKASHKGKGKANSSVAQNGNNDNNGRSTGGSGVASVAAESEESKRASMRQEKAEQLVKDLFAVKAEDAVALLSRDETGAAEEAGAGAEENVAVNGGAAADKRNSGVEGEQQQQGGEGRNGKQQREEEEKKGSDEVDANNDNADANADANSDGAGVGDGAGAGSGADDGDGHADASKDAQVRNGSAKDNSEDDGDLYDEEEESSSADVVVVSPGSYTQ